MKRRNVNFRQTKSERSADTSYRGFGKFINKAIKGYRSKNGKG